MKGACYLITLAAAVIAVNAGIVLPQAAAGSDLQAQERERRRNEAELNRRMAELHTLEQRLRIATDGDRRAPAEPRLSDEQRDRVLKLRKVDQADIATYSTLLGQPRTGIFKLFPDLGCISKNVVRITRDCERFVPLSSAFDFRKVGYGDNIYHDIRYEVGLVQSDSFFSQGIIATIGDAAIETIDLTQPAIRFLTEFKPDSDARSATQHAKAFRTGVESGGFRYNDSVEPHENTTYALRIIAYRLDNDLRPLSPELTIDEMMFHSLSYDKRLDLIVVFRVLRKDINDGYTIVWKELSRSEAPKINFAKGERMKDFRPQRRDNK